jgi:ParB/RepB/Spo0J family partition protein
MLLLELKTLDTSLEHTRTRNSTTERNLLASITEHDIMDPIQVVSCEKNSTYVILDGFKRYRCALKLKLSTVPAELIANDPVQGILIFIRRQQNTGLNILDQAALVEELHIKYHLSIYDIAVKLDRSPSWVSLRLGMLKDLSPLVKRKIMSGAFPARVYLYSIKGFTRVNRVPSERVDTFVKAVSGKRIGTRDLTILSEAFFSGSKATENLLFEGKIREALELIKNVPAEVAADNQINHFQRSVLQCLKNITSDMFSLVRNSSKITYENQLFSRDVHIWSSAVQKYLNIFTSTIKELYDRSGTQDCSTDIICSGYKEKTDCINA